VLLIYIGHRWQARILLPTVAIASVFGLEEFQRRACLLGMFGPRRPGSPRLTRPIARIVTFLERAELSAIGRLTLRVQHSSTIAEMGAQNLRMRSSCI